MLSLRVCKSASLQVCRSASLQVCKSAVCMCRIPGKQQQTQGSEALDNFHLHV